MKHGVPCDFENPEIVGDLQVAATPAAESPGSVTTPGPSSRSFAKPHNRRSSHASNAIRSPSVAASTPLYQQPPTPTVSFQPVGRLMELRLMHQYTSCTSKTLSFSAPITEEIWRTAVPNLAFAGSAHLTDGVLAVAALHLRSLWPNDKELVRASHAYMASSLSEYSDTLKKGINGNNAEALFLTASLIATQSTATRIFTKDESTFQIPGFGDSDKAYRVAGGYSPPLSWFHAFQGVKAVVAASWQYLKHSGVVVPIIDSQPPLLLDISTAKEGFFGHLLDDLDEELAALAPDGLVTDTPAVSGLSAHLAMHTQPQNIVTSTRQAYEHAVATLNWAHKIPYRGALAFPATVSKRFVELLEERQPRALAILASFFALLKTLDNVWWLQGMARREVLGVVSLFNSDYFGHEVERKWWPHLEWAVRIALYDDGQNGTFVPPEVWGTDWQAEEVEKPPNSKFTSHIEMLSQMASAAHMQALPPPTDE